MSNDNFEQMVSRNLSSIRELETIRSAAHDLEDYLSRNCGCNADWPVRIVADKDAVVILTEKMTALSRALKPYRERLKLNSKVEK